MGAINPRSHIHGYLHKYITVLTLLISVVVLFVGIGSIVISHAYLATYPPWNDIVESIGLCLFSTVSVLIVWELYIKRHFMTDILDKVKYSEQMVSSGIISITKDFKAGVDWSSYFIKARHMDLLFTYAYTWRRDHWNEIVELVKVRDSRVRVVLPDPKSVTTIDILVARTGIERDKLIDNIKSTIDAMLKLNEETGEERVSVWLLPQPLLYSYYRFDDVAVLGTYSYRKDNSGVLVLVSRRGGHLYEYLSDDFKEIVRLGGIGKKIERK